MDQVPPHPHDHGPAGQPHGLPGEHGFAPAVALNLGFVALEAVAGLLAGSLALLADAGHNLSDVLGLGAAWLAARLARRAPSMRHTYGLRRATILASLANAVLLLVAVGAIGVESVRRLFAPEPVATDWVLWVAAAGIVVNLATALLFARGRHADLNRRGAFLHMAADAGISAGVLAGALVMRWTGWLWLDPLIGLGIAAVILASGWGLLWESMNLALDAVPEGIDIGAVADCLKQQPGVVAVHHLHVWALGTTETALTAHLVRPGAGLDDRFLDGVRRELRERFAIGHATLQVEAELHEHRCNLESRGERGLGGGPPRRPARPLPQAP